MQIKDSKKAAIVGLIILVAIGGLVLYGKKDTNQLEQNSQPKIAGPSTPPPINVYPKK